MIEPSRLLTIRLQEKIEKEDIKEKKEDIREKWSGKLTPAATS